VTKRVSPAVELPREKLMSFESEESLSAGATVNLEKAAEIFYKGCEPESEIAKFVLKWAIRMVGILGVNTNFDPDDPEQIKQVLEGGTKALEEKNQIIHTLRQDVESARIEAEKEKTSRVKEEKRSAGLVTWIWRLIWFAILLFLIQIFTGIPVFSGLLGVLGRLRKQAVAGTQEFRETMKKKAEEGDVKAKEILALHDGIMDKHQDEKVKAEIKKLKIKINGKAAP